MSEGNGTGPTPAASRPTALRLARVHLRLGSLALARAELEAMAGRGRLDEDALLDLAEVRWRTGDLVGAGDAAQALIERGRADAIALVIAAESTAAIGRPGEARRLAGLALEATDEPLDTVFAGMPRSAIWPGEPAPAGDGAGPGAPGSPAAAPAAAAEAFAGGRAALAGGDAALAGLRFGVALRLEPAFAREVLGAVGEQPADPGLALVAGDALRLLGREAEARAAFDLARGVPPAPVPDAAPGPTAIAAPDVEDDEADDDAGDDDAEDDD